MNNTKRFYILSFIATIILGSLLHLAFDASNRNVIVGLVSPVNESVWEHFKLILLPSTLFTILFILTKRDKLNNSIFILGFSTIIASVFVFVFHYLYEYMGFDSSLIFDLLLYIVSIGIVFASIYIFKDKEYIANTNTLGIVFVFLIYMLFFTYTFYPPKLEVFRDSITNTYRNLLIFNIVANYLKITC